MLSSGLVFHNLLPPSAVILKGLKAEKFSSAFPVRLLLSALLYFSIIIFYLLILLNQFPVPLPMTSVRTKVNSTLHDTYHHHPPGQYASGVAGSEADDIESSDMTHIPTSHFPAQVSGNTTCSMGAAISSHPDQGPASRVWNQGTVTSAARSWQST